MNLALFISLLLVVATAMVEAKMLSNEKCEFKDTVDLTNQTRLENGSYLYRDIVVPEPKVASYNYILEFRNKSVDVQPHTRGCVCDVKQTRFCVKLCCERGEFFNGTTFDCEKIPEHLNQPSEVEILLPHNKRKKENIFEYFIPQVGRPCAKPEVLTNDEDIWDLMQDGMLQVYGENALLDSVSYCITPYYDRGTGEHILMPMSCPMKTEVTFTLLLNTYAMAISVAFLIPTIVVYILVKELRANLRGKLLICYLFSMALAYSIISFINITQVRMRYTACSVIGYSGYFFFMAAFMWLSVLCFDIWSNFKETNFEFNSTKNRIRFFLYSVYAWGFAGMLTGFLIWAQLSDFVTERYKPGIGIDMCWLDTRKWSAAIYFYSPNCIILVFNIITFTHLTVRIYTVRRDLARMTHKEKFFQENIVVILRLFLIMGVSWIMDILSYCVRNFKNLEFIFVLTDFCNAIQGVLIFVLFVLKRNVLALLKTRFGINTSKKVKPPRKSTASTSDGTSIRTAFLKFTRALSTATSTTDATTLPSPTP